VTTLGASDFARDRGCNAGEVVRATPEPAKVSAATSWKTSDFKMKQPHDWTVPALPIS
jgi:hypothetical protein